MEKQADINIRPNELEALKEAEVIRLTDGQEFVRKDVASKIMAKYAQQELQAYRERLREAIDLIIDIQDKWISPYYWGSETNDQTEAFIKQAKELIDTVTPTSNPEQS